MYIIIIEKKQQQLAVEYDENGPIYQILNTRYRIQELGYTCLNTFLTQIVFCFFRVISETKVNGLIKNIRIE